MKIDLGCGRKKLMGFFGVDVQSLPGVDLVADCNLPIPLPDNCADEVHARDFLEHINNDKRIHIISEIYRILKPNGLFYSATPSTDGRGAFQDPTHYSFWNENSFRYYTDDAHRNLYGIIPKFETVILYTTPKDIDEVCYVVATLKAIKPS